jgi:hypothetical protein
MRVVRLLVPLGRIGDVDEHATAFDLERERGNLVVLESGFAFAGDAVEFPLMPGAHDVIAVEGAVAERSADMIAGVRNGAEFSVAE